MVCSGCCHAPLGYLGVPMPGGFPCYACRGAVPNPASPSVLTQPAPPLAWPCPAAGHIRNSYTKEQLPSCTPSLQGGSFTISNLGMYGVDQFCAIINPPQASPWGLPGPLSRPAGMRERCRHCCRWCCWWCAGVPAGCSVALPRAQAGAAVTSPSRGSQPPSSRLLPPAGVHHGGGRGAPGGTHGGRPPRGQEPHDRHPVRWDEEAIGGQVEG